MGLFEDCFCCFLVQKYALFIVPAGIILSTVKNMHQLFGLEIGFVKMGMQGI